MVRYARYGEHYSPMKYLTTQNLVAPPLPGPSSLLQKAKQHFIAGMNDQFRALHS